MHQVSIYLVIVSVFLFSTGCGLIPISQMSAKEEQHQPVTESKQKSGNANVTNVKEDKQQLEKKPMITAQLFNRIKQDSITVDKTDKQDEPKHLLATNSIVIKSSPPKSTTNPKDEQTSPNQSTDNNNNTYNDSNQKYQEAQKKADELKNTDQVVRLEQGNVYQDAVETSNVVGQVLKDQKLHIENTQVDQTDNEIWCYVAGNDGNNDFSGWVSYNILR